MDAGVRLFVRLWSHRLLIELSRCPEQHHGFHAQGWKRVGELPMVASATFYDFVLQMLPLLCELGGADAEAFDAKTGQGFEQRRRGGLQ